MDDRDQRDTNVVNLRRKDDPDAGRRNQLASTIFAEEDEIATFSRGNLVPPRADAPRKAEHSGRPADAFFDRYQQEPSNGTAPADKSAELDGTADYFDQISARTPAEMAASARAPAAPRAMPGSAQLPADLPKTASRRRRLRVAAASVRRPVRGAFRPHRPASPAVSSCREGVFQEEGVRFSRA